MAQAQAILEFVTGQPLLWGAVKVLIVFAVLSVVIAFIVYVERKILAFMQARLGPMRVGPWGLLQAIADPVKLMLKEDIVPAGADKAMFLLAPVIGVIAAFTAFSVIPFTRHFFISDLNVGILFALAVSSLGIYGIILGGWASNSHYPLLGALRSSAQLVSYEVAAGIAVVGVILLSHSLSMVQIVEQQRGTWHWLPFLPHWNVFAQPIAFFVYLVAAIAETNRSPFDLPEAESELTAGFHTEYSGFRFALFFMAEYTAMVLVSCIAVTLFWGGWLRPFAEIPGLDLLRYAPPASLAGLAVGIAWLAWRTPVATERRFWLTLAVLGVALAALVARAPVLDAVQGIFWFSSKVILFLYAFIWYRGTFPRYRYDQLMNLGWHWMIPLALANLIGTAVVRYLASPHAASTAASLGR